MMRRRYGLAQEWLRLYEDEIRSVEGPDASVGAAS